MARRSPKKIQPAVTRLWFNIDPESALNFVDLSLAASAANRRFYRQGTTWAVAGMSLHVGSTEGATATGDFTVSKVPDTWVAKNAHTKAKALWMKSQDQVLDDQPSVAAKYRDFKVYLDDDMVGATVQGVAAEPATNGEIMLPVDSGDFTAKIGEWVYSTIQFPTDGGSSAPVEWNLHMVGADENTQAATSRGIIHGYALSRSRPHDIDPNVPTDGGWMNEVFDVADNLDEIRLDVTDNNDLPPYRVGDEASSDEFYPGGVNNQPEAALHSISFVTSSTVGGKTPVEGGMFGCGLMRFDWDIENAASIYLAIDLVPGHYKGYLTEVY
jgi:hypothetical protein